MEWFSLICKNVVAVTNYRDKPFDDSIRVAILEGCPNCEIHVIPTWFDDDKAENGYASSCGIYINSVVTYNRVYMPLFDKHSCFGVNGQNHEDCNIAAL